MSRPVLPDLLRPGLAIVFCGTQAGAASARRGAYYAGPGNRFWPVLHEIGLLPRRLGPEAFRELVDHGFGLTDLAKLTSGPDIALRRAHFGIAAFLDKMRAASPAIIAFNGKRAAAAVLGKPGAALAYGVQPEPLGMSAVHVLPSTSGAAAGFWSIEPWRALAAACQHRLQPG